MKASAGSGKTYRLARKYISLLLESKDRYAYRHILAVTFTNKATDEMKNRILKELHMLAVRPCDSGYHDYFVPSFFPSDDELQKKAGDVLSDILHDDSAFAVRTIDRFFQQTLKAFCREIGQEFSCGRECRPYIGFADRGGFRSSFMAYGQCAGADRAGRKI